MKDIKDILMERLCEDEDFKNMSGFKKKLIVHILLVNTKYLYEQLIDIFENLHLKQESEDS